LAVTARYKAFIEGLNAPYSGVKIFSLPFYSFYLSEGTEDSNICLDFRDILYGRSPHNRLFVGARNEGVPIVPRVKYVFMDPRSGNEEKLLKILKRYSSQSEYVLAYIPNVSAAEALIRLLTSEYEWLLKHVSDNGSLTEGDLIVGTSTFFRDMKNET
jgi:hypothetical protein